MDPRRPPHHIRAMSDTQAAPEPAGKPAPADPPAPAPDKPVEIGGPKGPEPTRFGDWEQKGRCTDF